MALGPRAADCPRLPQVTSASLGAALGVPRAPASPNMLLVCSNSHPSCPSLSGPTSGGWPSAGRFPALLGERAERAAAEQVGGTLGGTAHRPLSTAHRPLSTVGPCAARGSFRECSG